MKTIAPTAMAAIEAGEAIVTGAVEISPIDRVPTLLLPTGTTVELAFWHRAPTGEFVTDTVKMGLAFLDPSGTAIGGVNWSGTYNNTSSWAQNSVSVASPEGAAKVRLYQWIHKGYGTHPHFGFIDDITLKLDGSPVTFSNGGAESGVSGWIDTTAYALSALGVTDGVTPHSGSAMFGGNNPYGASGNVITAYTDLGSTELATGIDLIDSTALPPIRLWGGYGPITIDGNEYQGIGARGLAQQNGGALGGIAQGVTLSLSGLESAALALLDGDEIKAAPVVLYRMIFASDGKTLLDAHVFDRGRVDTVGTDEVIGADAAINVAVESAARGLGRAGARMRADSDQRLIDADDGYFKETAYAGEKTLYWGGKKPFRR